MAKETLAIPEDCLLEVIEIIRLGLKHKKKISDDIKYNLEKWCDEEEKYMKGNEI